MLVLGFATLEVDSLGNSQQIAVKLEINVSSTPVVHLLLHLEHV